MDEKARQSLDRMVEALRSNPVEIDPRVLRATYETAMGRDAVDFDAHDSFTLRQWDGMDGCWCDDEAKGVTAEVALKLWFVRTHAGTQHTSYNDIDYYNIFPADTSMVWDGGEGREMFR